MERFIDFGQGVFCYTLQRYASARNIRIILRDGKVSKVTAPKHIADSSIERFLQKQESWIVKHVRLFSSKQEWKVFAQKGDGFYRKNKKQAYDIVKEKLELYNTLYGFVYNRVSIRNQSSRWGSCSSQKNLNFNYKIIFLPDDVADYIVVHELCHLEEMNHSEDFWRLVAYALPAYKDLRKKLKQYTKEYV